MSGWAAVARDGSGPRLAVLSLVSELELTVEPDGVPTDYVVSFDNLQTVCRAMLRRRVATLSPARMAQACRTLAASTGC